MNLNQDTVFKAIHPTAAFVNDELFEGSRAASLPSVKSNADVSWSDSSLNPKNRFDSLTAPISPKWRIDGASSLGTQFYVVPIMESTVPFLTLRIDVHISDVPSAETWDLLSMSTPFHLTSIKVSELPISHYIVRVLDQWTSTIDNFSTFFNSLPFGSRINLENLSPQIARTHVRVVKMHTLEKQYLSVPALARLWKLTDESALPPRIDLTNLRLIRQLHDSVSLVRIPGAEGLDGKAAAAATREGTLDELPMGKTGPCVVFKTLTNSPSFMYHEIRTLLSLEPHANIVARPLHLVTRRCKFGGKVAVVGFTLRYYAAGSLANVLPRLLDAGTLRLTDQLRWATQLTSALIHIYERGASYCDLRLDNVLLSGAAGDVVMVDFEQRGLWSGICAPELGYLEVVRVLAESDGRAKLPAGIRQKYAELLRGLAPAGWDGARRQQQQRQQQRQQQQQSPGEAAVGAAVATANDDDDDYDDDDDDNNNDNDDAARAHGLWLPWRSLTTTEREAATVYLLGRVLWCIFEGRSVPEATVWASYERETTPAARSFCFPEFGATPAGLRQLIVACTRGFRAGPERRRGDTRYGGELERRGSKLRLVRGRRRALGEGEEGEEVGAEVAESEAEIRREAAAWWKEELGDAEEFLEMRRRRLLEGESGNWFGRPSLRDVMAVLEGFDA